MRGLEMLEPDARASAIDTPAAVIPPPDPAISLPLSENDLFSGIEKPDVALRGVQVEVNGEPRGSYPYGQSRTLTFFRASDGRLIGRVTSAKSMKVEWYEIQQGDSKNSIRGEHNEDRN